MKLCFFRAPRAIALLHVGTEARLTLALAPLLRAAAAVMAAAWLGSLKSKVSLV